MHYAKVNETGLIKYPYTWEDLRAENPYTNFDNRYDLPAWYLQTKDAYELKAWLTMVEITEAPDYDSRTQTILRGSVPVFENGTWFLKFDLVQKTIAEELTSTQTVALTSEQIAAM